MKRVVWGLILTLLLMIPAGLPCAIAAERSYNVTATYSIREGDVVSTARPLVAWQFNGMPVEQLQLAVFLDGRNMAVRYDRSAGAASCKVDTPLSPGKHRVVYQAQLREQVVHSYVANFVVIPPPVRPPADAEDVALALRTINELRRPLGLAGIVVDEHLQDSAQNHSDYSKAHGVTGHFEQPGASGYTGWTPQQRAAYAGYLGFAVAEVGTSEAGAIAGAIRSLFDAPVHRVAYLNPNFTQAGVGVNRQTDGSSNNSLFIDFGAAGAEKERRIVQYPYPEQREVKLAWYDAESPNPLAEYGLSQVYVGYPITIAVYDAATQSLQTELAVLTDERGELVPTYQVESRRLEGVSPKCLMLIPQQTLRPGTGYQVEFRGARVFGDGRREVVARTWHFTTTRQLRLGDAQIITLAGREYLDVFWDCGPLPDGRYSLLDSKGAVVQTYVAGEGFARWGDDEFVPGNAYQLVVQSEMFQQVKQYQVEITGAMSKRSVRLTLLGNH